MGNNLREQLLGLMCSVAGDGCLMADCGVQPFKPGISDRMLFRDIVDERGPVSSDDVTPENAVQLVAVAYQERFSNSFYEF